MKITRYLLLWSFLIPSLVRAQFDLGLGIFSGVRPEDRIRSTIDERTLHRLRGTVHPLARPENDTGRAPASRVLHGMILVLQKDATQQAALDQLTAVQQDPQSPQFHQWLTPESYGEHFGVSVHDQQQLIAWLQNQGFTLDDIAPGRWTMTFSGTVARVEHTFHTEIHLYQVQSAGTVRYANATELQVPEAVSEVVAGVIGLNNFPPHGAAALSTKPRTQYGGQYFLSPTDFATIYNLNPLYNRGITGTGQTIGIVGKCAIDTNVVAAFRQQTNLAANPVEYLWVKGDPPSACTPDSGLTEAYLDVEWSGAVAPRAQILYIAGTNIEESANTLVNYSRPPIISTSYLTCEASLVAEPFWNTLWQQAATQGITAAVSSGDYGAAGCYDPNNPFAPLSQAVNGIASTPYNVAVGGTQFDDTANPGLYWSSAGSALSYIPEVAWNECGTSGLLSSGLCSSGGGYSTLYPRPSWQTGNNTTQRGLPDVSLSAAQHEYLINTDTCSIKNLCRVGGTSAAAPAFAGIMALVNQATNQPQGNPNPNLYALASRHDVGTVFHDITSGNNSFPGITGYNAGPGWDPVTGLGSVDANALVTHWDQAFAPGGGFTIQNGRLTSQAPPSQGCTIPPPATSFQTSQGVVYLYFEATTTPSDTVTSDWLAPNGTVFTGGSWNSSSGTFCFASASLNIASLSGTLLGTWQARIYDNGTIVASLPFAVTSSATSPSAVNGVVNAASWSGGPVAPGELVTIAGSLLGPSTGVSGGINPSTGHLVTQLAGTTVFFSGVAAPLLYVSATQVNAVVPYEVAGCTQVTLQVQFQANISAGTSLPCATAAPGIFTFNASGTGQAAAANQDGTVNGPSSPAAKGSYVTLYFTGGGETNPPGVTGALTGTSTLKWLTQTATVTVGGVPTTVTFDGDAPTFVDGFLQLNIQLSQNTPSGSVLPVVLTVGNASSPATATLAVQ